MVYNLRTTSPVPERLGVGAVSLMLHVRTTIGPSRIHGTGLFAAESIRSGAVIWNFTPGFDRKFTREEIVGLPVDARVYLAMYAYKSQASGAYVLPEDNGKYFNHSDTPNTRSVHPNGGGEVITYAVRDIVAGEELTDDYASFEDPIDAENILADVALLYGSDTAVDQAVSSTCT
jgi:hypothetical protein